MSPIVAPSISASLRAVFNLSEYDPVSNSDLLGVIDDRTYAKGTIIGAQLSVA